MYFYQAFKLFEAKTLENPQASDKYYYRMGMMVLKGDGLPIDIPKASRYFEESAYGGNVQAQYQLGMLYFKGSDGLDRNVDKALEFLAKASAGGNANAHYELAKLILANEELERDESYAFALMRSAAAQGNAKAGYEVAKNVQGRNWNRGKSRKS